ncbi:MAG: GNAT family N-acetyltransferase [Thermodesulfobacteriota bacterium]
MEIQYRTTQSFERSQLQQLFLAVEWSSGNYPDRLQTAMKNADTVFSAWDGTKLVGLMHAVSDGVMTAYFQYLLVHPDYQSRGIGNALVTAMLGKYKDCARKVLIAYDKEIEFYKSCGFLVGHGKTPMFITYLST